VAGKNARDASTLEGVICHNPTYVIVPTRISREVRMLKILACAYLLCVIVFLELAARAPLEETSE
jgi:hypothetical protein